MEEWFLVVRDLSWISQGSSPEAGLVKYRRYPPKLSPNGIVLALIVVLLVIVVILRVR